MKVKKGGMIRHKDDPHNKKTYNFDEVLKIFGYDPYDHYERGEAFVERKSVIKIFDGSDSYISNMIGLEKDEEEYFIKCHSLCSFKAGILVNKPQIAQHLYIHGRTLSNYLKLPGIPIYHIKTKKEHSLFTLKNSIAHWYFNYLLRDTGSFRKAILKNTSWRYATSSHSKNLKRLQDFAKNVKCHCGKNLFLIPGINFKDISVKEQTTFLKTGQLKVVYKYLKQDPKCPVCKKPTFPCDAHHSLIYL